MKLNAVGSRVVFGMLGLWIAGAAVEQAHANGNVYVSRFWHNHQPLYWPEWNSNGPQTQRGQYAWDSITLKPGQNYGGISLSQHPENNLTDIFGLDDRKSAYQQGPRNSLQNVDSRGGFGVSYSGSLIDNVRQLGGGGHLGYGGNWNAGYREARGWKTPAGSTRMDMLGFTYHHSLGPLLPKSVFRKEVQAFKDVWWKAWGGNSDKSDHSKGFFPTEMGYSRHLVDVLVDEGYEWTLVASHHISRTSPSYNDRANPEGSYGIYSSPPNKADQISPRFDNVNQWWYGMPNPGNAAWNVAPFAYQLHRVKYVNPETGAEKKMYAVPSDDVLSYRYGYANEGISKIDTYISPHANTPVIVIPSTDGDNAWGGGSSSWNEATPQLFSESANRGYKPSAPQDFVNAAKGGVTQDSHIEDGAWIFPEMCYGSPNFLKWIEPPVATVANRGKTTHPGTQVDMETPGFALKFFSYAPLMAGANWLETAEQVLRDENGGNDLVNEWKIASPYDWDGTWTQPNDVELAWHIYLKGLDSGFNYYGGLGNDDEVKPALATKNAIDKLQNFMTTARKAKDKTGPTVLKPQRFPYNPGAYTFGWFNQEPHINNNAFLKKMPSWFYIWTHAYDINGVSNIQVKVRIDNDGTNPINSNQNETYAGGSEVGSWVSINMTKRVLPKTRSALNTAAANGQIDYFVFDPAFWANPVIADYYFAKIDDASLPNFRDKLIDYYVESVDALGNTNKSEIQHVWVANDGIAPASSVSFSANPSDCAPITVTYNAANGPLQGLSPVTMQISFNNGSNWTGYTMSSSSSNVWTYTISAPDNAPSAIVWFESGTNIDSRSGQNWSTTIRDCDAPPAGPVWTVPFTPIAGQTVTVHYNPTGRVLSAAASVNIHHGYNENITANWTPVPGVPMIKSGSIWTYTYTVPSNATIVRYVFNNNSGTWDNNGGGNWNIDVTSLPVTNPPAAPTGLNAQANSSSSVSLTWNASSLATAYLVYRDGALIGSPQGTSYVDNNLQPETTYLYYVRATNTIGLSATSATVSVTTPFSALSSGSLLVLNPAHGLSTSGTNVSFNGRAAFNFTSIVWSNRLTGQTGAINRPADAPAIGWTWNFELPLGSGSNDIQLSGIANIAGSVTNTDSPTLYTTWTNGSRQGSGFNEWYTNHSGNAGNFLADNPTNMHVGTTKGFGLWANGGGRAAVTRSLATPMKPGDSFNVRFDNNWVNTGSQVGFEMRDNSGAVRFRFYFVGGESFYRINDSATGRVTTLAYTDNGLNLNLNVGTNNTYTLNSGSGALNGTLGAGEAITWLEFFNSNAGPDTPYNVYIGAMSHIVLTTGIDATSTNITVTRNAPATDSNSDGIPDDWFSRFGMSPTNTAGALVPGGEMTFAQAYVFDVNPTSPPAGFNRAAMNTATGAIATIEINPSSTARLYNVFWVPELGNQFDWTNTIGNFVPGTGGRLSFTITNAIDLRYYRTGVKLP